MSVNIISSDQLSHHNLDHFTNTIYDNFADLAQDESLNHTKTEIFRVLKSPMSQVYLILENKKIIAYLVGEIMDLNDGRRVLYITYLYTAPRFRKQGLASKLLDTANHIANKNYLDAVMLTCDSNDKYVYNFYQKKGYMPDLTLRRYSRYEVLSKSLN